MEPKRRGRRLRSGQQVELFVHLRLWVEEDDDLIAFFERIPLRHRSAALKAALRAGGLPAQDNTSQTQDDEVACALENLLL